jgi:hypothetical protein
MAISKRELPHIGFAPRPETAVLAAEISIRPLFATGPGGRIHIGIARRAADNPNHPIFNDRPAHDEPMTRRRDAGRFTLTRTENGRSASLKAEWL